MVFRVPRAVFLLVLVVVLYSRPMGRVFVGQGIAQRRLQRSRMQSLLGFPVESLHNPLLDFVEQRPMIGHIPLDVGALVGYELDPTRFIHAAIYVGRGDSELLKTLGFEDLNPLKHYVIEFGKPNQTCSQDWKALSGKDQQCICITEMKSSWPWQRYELSCSNPLSSPDQTVRRAACYIGSSFGDSYDLQSNNCQHFATWVKYRKKLMLPGPWEGKLQAAQGQIPGYLALFAFSWAKILPLVVGAAAFCLVKLLSAKTHNMTQTSINFEHHEQALSHFQAANQIHQVALCAVHAQEKNMFAHSKIIITIESKGMLDTSLSEQPEKLVCLWEKLWELERLEEVERLVSLSEKLEELQERLVCLSDLLS